MVSLGICCLQVLYAFHAPERTPCHTGRPELADTVRHSRDTVKKYTIRNETDYSVMFSNLLFLNWLHDKNVNQAGFLQNLKYNFTVEKKTSFKLSGNFCHSLGFQSYFDSITKVQTDDNTLTVNVDFFLKSRFHLSFSSVSETQLLNGYLYSGINGSTDKTRISSFLTPLVCTISLGTAVEWKKFGSLNLGISGLKITWLRDHRIADLYGESFYNVPQGKYINMEYGLSLHFIADREIIHGVQWNCDVLLFKNYKKSVDMTLKNMFGIRINKFLKTNLQTSILYEKQVTDHLQVENFLSFGIYLHK